MSVIVSLADIAPAQSSFVYDGSLAHAVALTPEVEDMLRAGHAGPRLLVHSHLGGIEWHDSLPSCERLALHLGWELVVVKRAAGDLISRWRGRWANNAERYRNLGCVKLMLPWSTPSMRFCTSELKTQVIASAVRKRFPARPILNVTGIRWQESARRSEMPIAKPMAQLERKAAKALAWNAIIDWRLPQGPVDRAGCWACATRRLRGLWSFPRQLRLLGSLHQTSEIARNDLRTLCFEVLTRRLVDRY
jgi:hypothetical protein